MARVNRIDRQVTERVVVRAREAAGLQKCELAEKLGLSKSGYTPYEKFEGVFTVDQLFRLSSILGRSVEYFLGLDHPLTADEDHMLGLYRQAKEMGLAEAIVAAAEAMVGVNRP